MNHANVFDRNSTVFKISTGMDGQDELLEQPLQMQEQRCTRGQVFTALAEGIDQGFQLGAVNNGPLDAKHRITLVRYPDMNTIEKESFSAELDTLSLEIEFAYYSLVARAAIVATPLPAWFFALGEQIKTKLGYPAHNLATSIASAVVRALPMKPSVAVMSAMIAARLIKGDKHFDGREFAEWVQCFTNLNRNAAAPYLVACEYAGHDVNDLPGNLFPI